MAVGGSWGRCQLAAALGALPRGLRVLRVRLLSERGPGSMMLRLPAAAPPRLELLEVQGAARCPLPLLPLAELLPATERLVVRAPQVGWTGWEACTVEQLQTCSARRDSRVQHSIAHCPTALTCYSYPGVLLGSAAALCGVALAAYHSPTDPLEALRCACPAGRAAAPARHA